jgi:hypothetical protein
MNQTDFITALEQELQLQGVAFSRSALQVFVADGWPLIEDNPDPVFWAEEFIDSGRTSMTF